MSDGSGGGSGGGSDGGSGDDDGVERVADTGVNRRPCLQTDRELAKMKGMSKAGRRPRGQSARHCSE
jgi:hypothetical protein